MKRVARSIYRWMFWPPALVLAGVIVVALRTIGDRSAGAAREESIPLLLGSIVLLYLWYALGRKVIIYLIPLFVSHIACPGCGERIGAVNVWNCGCGFRDHKERHILAKVCPKCGERTGHVNCPRCDCTILFW